MQDVRLIQLYSVRGLRRSLEDNSGAEDTSYTNHEHYIT